MSPRKFLRALAVSVPLLFGLVAVPTATAAVPTATAPAPAAAAARTVYYSASAYGGEADQAAAIWNRSVPNLRLVRSGNGSIRISGTSGGGSRAYMCGLGCATIYIDRQDIARGNSSLRIVSHEMGHGLGLRDNYNGVCSQLMSGGSAGTGCRNPYPDSREAGLVNQWFGGYAGSMAATPQNSSGVSSVYSR
ncbi:snapalysin family zinc-dependent metalloprotease [Amycolatopsis thailandensis]|uniref:snapalysin family zinc-dependent metalloprotease n=1 Tax=Amycolatopsis thailandensis TaxID=589330 RepID=UPI0036613872